MQTTTNFNLPKWEKSDRIMMSDFNDMTEKLDTALTARNCQLYYATYAGDGANSRTLQFPAKPIFVVMISGTGFTMLNRGRNIGVTFWSVSAQYEFPVTWGDTSVTLTHTGTPAAIANNSNGTFGLFAILEAE